MTPPADRLPGVLWMLLGMALVVSSNPLVKALSQSYATVEILWGRYVFQLVFLALLFRARLPRVMATERPALQLARSGCQLAFALFFYAGLAFLPLAETNALLFVSPLIVSALSAPLLGERVDARRWLGVAAGFAGALVIVRPGAEAMRLAALLPLAAALFSGLYQLSTRLLSHSESVETTFAYTSVVGALVTSLAVPFLWTTPDAVGWLLMAGVAFLTWTGHFAIVKAFSLAPAPTVTPYTYTILVWAALYGFFLFGEVPDAWTLAGAAVIVGSGLHVFAGERRAREARPGADA
jgi:drug/metabolite transporter (DMT)-like permease